MTWKLDLGSYHRKPQSSIPSCIEDLINNDNMICRLLHLIYGHDHHDVRQVEVRPLTPGSDIKGNLSDCGRISITVKTYGGAKYQYSWFVKVQPQEHQNSELLNKFNLFQNEIEFYQKIAPELKQFVDEYNESGKDFEFDIPELIHAEADEERAIIILEDLVGAGYKQVKDENGEKYLSKENAILAVESIAKIHAASYALQIKKNIDLGHIHPNLEMSGLLWSNDEMASRLTAMKDYYCDILKLSKKPDSPDLVERFQRTFDSTEKLKEMCKKRSEHDNNNKGIFCLQQGDFHFNNLMFKEEGDKVKVKIVDWQMTYSGRVGGDIAYLLMSSIAPQLYEAEEEAIKEKYFARFNKSLHTLIAERKRSLVEEMLKKDYDESLPLGFLFSCGNVMSQGEKEKHVSFAYQLCNEAAHKNLI